MRKLIATGAAGLALAGGSLAIAATGLLPAGAQETQQTQTQPSQNGQKSGHPGLRRHAAKGAVKTAADTIGIPPKDLVKELKGKSLTDVANAHGVNPQTVADALVSKANERIDEAVTNGKISAEKAAEVKAKVPEKVSKLMTHVFDGSHRPNAGQGQNG